MSEGLDERKTKILHAIIQTYLETGEPVGSRTVSYTHLNLVRELLSPQLNHMFVTPKDIDAEIKRMSYTISEAINLAFCG